MATKEDIKDALYGDLRSVISNNTSVSTPDEHVDLLRERGQDADHPFIGFEVFGRPNNRGFDGNVHVDELVYTNGEIDHVVYRRDTILTVHIGILTDDGAHPKDQLYEALVDHFSEYDARNNPEGLHTDVDNLEDGGFTDIGGDDVHGDRQEYTLEYSRYFKVDSFVPIREIDVTIEHLEEDTIYHEYQVTA